MTITLYAATIPSYCQILEAVSAFLDKAEAFCDEAGIDHGDIIQARLADDMLPFAYQVKSTAIHSIGAIEGVRKGTFSPDRAAPPESFVALKERLASTLAALRSIEPSEMEGFVGRDMRFQAGDFVMNFTAEDFLLSFSQPNFYFHATTAYDILRWKGVSVGKMDFVGRLRRKT